MGGGWGGEVGELGGGEEGKSWPSFGDLYLEMFPIITFQSTLWIWAFNSSYSHPNLQTDRI